jgi:hypothetical protein
MMKRAIDTQLEAVERASIKKRPFEIMKRQDRRWVLLNVLYELYETKDVAFPRNFQVELFETPFETPGQLVAD